MPNCRTASRWHRPTSPEQDAEPVTSLAYLDAECQRTAALQVSHRVRVTLYSEKANVFDRQSGSGTGNAPGSSNSHERVVGIALLSEAAALWFDAEVIIHRPLNPPLAAEIPFGCLHGHVAQKELNLLQFTACGMAQLCARAAKIMRSEPRKTEFLRVLFHHVPDHPLRYSITPAGQ